MTRREVLGGVRRNLCHAVLAIAITSSLAPYAVHAQSTEARVTYDIPAGDLASAIDTFSMQSGLQVLYKPELLIGKRANRIAGSLSSADALGRILYGSGVTAERVNSRTFVLKTSKTKPAIERPTRAPTFESMKLSEEDIVRMPAIMVQGKRTLNMDITRSRNDPQPYVVFDREQIERSGASSLEQFLQQRLTMNTMTFNTGQSGGAASTSQITLRGLSGSQTLILIDGHRVSSPGFSLAGIGSLNQADINGIPLSAIERIEILPTTASGIYGGNATGGVINVIMRRDYTGAEVKFTYDNTFSSDTAGRRVDMTFGYNSKEGKTNLLVTANYAEANDLLNGDRDFSTRGRESSRANNPNFALPPSNPPLGATPNIRSTDGSNLVLRDGTPLNSSFTSVPIGYAGVGTDGGLALVGNAGIYNWDSANSAQLDPSSGRGNRSALYTQPMVKAGALALRHQIDDSLQLFTDISSSQTTRRFPANEASYVYFIPASSPTNPFQQDIQVVAPLSGADSEIATTIEHDRALLGFIKQLPRNWQLGADYTWDRTTVNYSSTLVAPSFDSAVATGAVDILRDPNVFPIDLDPYLVLSNRTSPIRSTMKDVSLRASGPVGALPGGVPTLSASLAYRDEGVSDSFSVFPAYDAYSYYPNRSQTVTSAYLELRVPFFSEKNSRPGLRELELQLAVRRDAYTSESGESVFIFGPLPPPLPEARRTRNEFASIDPTIALRWKPWQYLTLRASYGTGFLPPALDQLISTTPFPAISFGTDPLRGNTTAGPFAYVAGGNPNLKPEQSESWSAGLILTPSGIPNFRLSVDYTRIKKTDNIGNYPGFFQGIINDENLLPGRVVRGPNLPNDPSGWAGPITFLDVSALNLASTDLEAWDVQLDFRKETDRYGAFELFFMGTWQPHYRTQALRGEPTDELAGISTNPLKFKSNLGLTWTQGGWRAGWSTTHFNSYQALPFDTIDQGNNGKIPSQTYHDAFASYDFGLSGGNVVDWLENTEIQLGVRNIFNKRPPFDAGSSSFYSPFGDPRLSSYYLSIKTRF